MNETQVVRDNEDLVQRIRRQLSKNTSIREDLLQEGRIALVRAARTWQAESGTQFRTYATNVVRNAMVNFLKAQRQRPACVSMDEPAENGESLHDTIGSPATQEDDIAGARRANHVHAAAAALASKPRRDVAVQIARGVSLEEIARGLGTNAKRVSETYHRAFPALRQALAPLRGDS